MKGVKPIQLSHPLLQFLLFPSIDHEWLQNKTSIHSSFSLFLQQARGFGIIFKIIYTFQSKIQKKHKNLCFTTEKTHFSLCKKTLHVKGGLIRIWVEFVFSNRKWMVQKGLVFSHYFFLFFMFSVLLLVIGQENLAIQVSFERKFVAY